MGAYKHLMMEFCDSRAALISDPELRAAEWDRLNQQLIDGCQPMQAAMHAWWRMRRDVSRVQRIVSRIQRAGSRADYLRRAARLWNALDSHPTPEPLWQVMLDGLPFAFAGPSANHILAPTAVLVESN